MRCCPAGWVLLFVGRSSAVTPAGNEQEELNESRPRVPFRGAGCDFLIALLFIPSGTQLPGGAGISSEGRHCPLLDPARTVENALPGTASLPKSIFLCRAFIAFQL